MDTAIHEKYTYKGDDFKYAGGNSYTCASTNKLAEKMYYIHSVKNDFVIEVYYDSAESSNAQKQARLQHIINSFTFTNFP